MSRCGLRNSPSCGGSGRSRLNVLITTSYYWPEELGSAPYLAGLADYLQERGHHVVVATGYPHYPEWRLPPHTPLFRTEWHGAVEVRRRWHYVPRKQSAAHRALYEASFFSLGLTALTGLPRPDVVVGTCPTLAAGGLAAVAAAVYRAPYALIFQDLMGQAARQSGVRGGAYVAATVRRAECLLARRAAGIGIVAEGFRTYLEQGGVPPENIRRLRNWTRRIEPTESVDEIRRRFGWGADEFICLHGGNLGLKQGLDNLLDAAALLRDEGVRIVFSGDGNDRERLEHRTRQLDLHDVQFIGLLREPGLYEAVARASDVLLVNQRPSVTDMSLPSKLTSYFAAARPVIAAASADSETAREVNAAQAGFVVAPDDPTALSNAIMALRRDPDATASMAARAKQYADEYLSPRKVLSEYEQFLEEIAPRREARKQIRERRPFGLRRRRAVLSAARPTPLTPRIAGRPRPVEAPGGAVGAELQEIRTAFPRVAIVHDWLTVPGGSEQVLAALLDLFPDAEVFTSVYDPERFPPNIRDRIVHASVLARLPRASRWYPRMLPLMRGAFRRFDLRSFDLILSSSHAFAKSARAEGRPHVCYCHTPLRLLWEPRFLAGEPVGPVGRASAHLLRPHLRRVDRKDADALDSIMANSTYTAERIRRYWGRNATVVHPPVAVEGFLGVAPKPGASYVVLGRIVPYKRVDLAVAACAQLGRPVTVIGEGRALEQATAVAGPGARFLGRVSDGEVQEILAEAKAVICCADEDFGIVPVEAQAAGVPVIAYGIGGHRDSVEDGRHGVLFYEQTVEAVAAAIERFEQMEFDPAVLRENARRFSTERFNDEVASVLLELIRGRGWAEAAVAQAS